jgi:hypothetical protein
MAQGDLFKQFTEAGGVLERAFQGGVVSAERMVSILNDVYTAELNIGEAKKNLKKSDTDSLNVLKRIVSVGKKIKNQQKENLDIKKKIIKDEKFLGKIQEKIDEARKTGNNELAEALEKQLLQKKVALQFDKASLQQLRKTIPVLGRMGSVGAAISDSMVKVGGVFGSILSVVGSIAGGLFKVGATLVKLILAPLKKAFNIFLEMQSTVGNLAADIGLTAIESRALLNNFASLTLSAMKFGGSMKDVATVIQQFSEVTGKNRFFNEREIEQLVELGLGTGLGVQGASELAASFDNIGLSLEKTIDLTEKARNMSAKMNLNTTKVLKTYQGLVQSLTGIGFGKGLDNLTKLSAKATAIRFDIVASTKAFADAFFEPEKAVEAAAKMQVLGGKFAQNFGDPMQLAFESMSDPTALAEKFANTVSAIVAKDSKGNYFIPPAERKSLKIAAETLGQSYEDAVGTAIEQAKIADKMTALSKSGFSMTSFSEEDRLAVAGLMKVNEKGEFVIKNSAGVETLLSNMTDKNQLKQIIESRKSNENAAIQRKNLMERLSLIVDRFMVGFTKVFDRLFGGTEFESFLQMVEQTGNSIAKFITEDLMGGNGLTELFKSILESGKSVFEQIGNIFSENKEESLFKKIGKSISLLFNEFVLPSVIKLFNYIKPLLDYTFGSFLEVIGDILPDVLGGSKAKRKGLEMQQSAFEVGGKEGGIMKDIFGEKGVQKKQEKIATDISESKKIGGGERVLNFLTGGLTGTWNTLLNSLNFAFTDMKSDEYLKKQMMILNENMSDLTFGYTDKMTGYDPYEKGKSYGNFNDGVIYKDGSYAKFNKGDMVQFIDQAAMERASSGTGSGSSNSVQHSGVITIKSDDGKVVTWDQMYGARDLIGSRMASISDSYDKGFGNYQNPNKSPIQPLI